INANDVSAPRYREGEPSFSSRLKNRHGFVRDDLRPRRGAPRIDGTLRVWLCNTAWKTTRRDCAYCVVAFVAGFLLPTFAAAQRAISSTLTDMLKRLKNLLNELQAEPGVSTSTSCEKRQVISRSSFSHYYRVNSCI